MNNIIRAVFNPGDDTTKAYGLYQWNYGQKLEIHGLDIPRAVEVHFAATGDTEAIVRIGTTVDKVTTVPIPDVLFEQDMDIKAYVYLSDAESGETIKTINMPMVPRQKPEGWNGSEETTMGAIMDAINQFADGKADGLDYKDNILKLMSGEAELARVTIAGGAGGTAREIELQKSETAIQWRYVGEEEWRELVLLEELKPTGEQITEVVGKYLEENPIQGGATKEQAEQIKKNKDDIDELKDDLEQLKQSGGTGTGSSATTAQASSLWAVLQKAVFAEVLTDEELNDFKTAWGITAETIPATGITLDKSTLSFTTSATQTLIATVTPSNSTDNITWESSDTGIATVSGGVVTPVSNGSCTITAKVGNYSASCEVTVEVESEIVTYTITNSLTNVSTDNPVTTITENSSYEANLTPDTGHEFDSIIVTMGGVDVTSDVYTNGAISILAVTGNIIIAASAIQPGSTEEITLLKSITGDGNSYIDTEFIVDDSTYVFELSAKLADSDTVVLFGADGYEVGSAYGLTKLHNNGNGYLCGSLNNNGFNNCGTWNNGGVNSLVGNQWFAVIKDGLQAIYLDAEHTTQQANVRNTTTTYGTEKEYVPIPLYLFTANRTSGANATYTPCDCTIYFFKISNSNGDIIHEYLPARQGTKIGMYDTVTQKFHENKGTGTFSYEEADA